MVVADKPSSNTQTGSTPGVDRTLENRFRSVRVLTVVACVLSGLLSAGLAWVLFGETTWQIGVLAGLFVVTAGFCYFALKSLYPRKSYLPGVAGVSLLFGLAILATSALLTGLGVPLAVVYLIFILIISSATLTDRQANLAVVVGIVISAFTALASDYSPFPQVTIPMVGVVTPVILGALFIVYIVMQSMRLVTMTLRVRLVSIFMAIVIIPLAILSILQSQFMFNELTNRANEAQLQAAQQTAFGMDQYLADKQKSLQEIAELDIFNQFLGLSKDHRTGTAQEIVMKLTLQALDANELRSTVYLSSYALLDMDGRNLYDTLSDRFAGQVQVSPGTNRQSILKTTGDNEGQEDYFLVPARSGVPYISQVQITNSTRAFLFISAPIKNNLGKTIGVLRARYDGQVLQDLLKQYNGLLGDQSYGILLDDNNVRLADQLTPNNLYKSIAPLPQETVQILKKNRRLADLTASMLSTNWSQFDQLIKNYEAVPVFRTEVSLPGKQDNDPELVAVTKMRSTPWKVAYLRMNFNDQDLRLQQRRLITLVTTVIAAVVGLIAVGAAQLLSSPITRLTKTAQRISSGDLEAQATVRSADEFGMLGAAFNSMTSQLRALIGQLEDRVKSRTEEIEKQNKALTHRAAQLQTVAEVARRIVSAQELETLLSSITRLVSDRFGFYHVGIFLLDEKKENAVLRAANSEGGQRMLARSHSLPVGKVGIVGYATGTGQARIATDVGEDAVFFNNPDLPNTRSEMALPLKIGGQVTGAIDIQSTQPNSFKEEDIELFSTLADQIAIAIYNNQLYVEALQALDEAQNVHRQYLHSEWAQDIAQRKTLGYLFNQTGITPQQAENPLWKKVFHSGDPVYAVLPSSNGSPDKAVMAVPIAVRGETIGVIHVQDQGEGRLWSEDEITMVNSIANQVAVALENARLFENTVRRAEREKKVLQITAAIRSTNDPEEMMRIAVNELQQALHATRTQIYIRQEDSEEE